MRLASVFLLLAIVVLLSKLGTERSQLSAASLAEVNRNQTLQLGTPQVFLRGTNKWTTMSEMIRAGTLYLADKAPEFNATNAVVTVWIDSSAPTNAIRIVLQHGFREDAIRLFMTPDGGVLGHTSFVLQEHSP